MLVTKIFDWYFYFNTFEYISIFAYIYNSPLLHPGLTLLPGLYAKRMRKVANRSVLYHEATSVQIIMIHSRPWRVNEKASLRNFRRCYQNFPFSLLVKIYTFERYIFWCVLKSFKYLILNIFRTF